jgi:hypothetical protein
MYQRPHRYELNTSCAHDCPLFLTLIKVSLYPRENVLHQVRIYEKVISSCKILNSLVRDCEDNCFVESDTMQYGSYITIPTFQKTPLFSRVQSTLMRRQQVQILKDDYFLFVNGDTNTAHILIKLAKLILQECVHYLANPPPTTQTNFCVPGLLLSVFKSPYILNIGSCMYKGRGAISSTIGPFEDGVTAYWVGGRARIKFRMEKKCHFRVRNVVEHPATNH